MISKGREDSESAVSTNYSIIIWKMCCCAKEIQMRLDSLDEKKGVGEMEAKYNALNWAIGKIEAEYSKSLQYFRNLPYYEKQYYIDVSSINDGEYDTLESVLSLIISMQEDGNSLYWEQVEEGHYLAEFIMYILMDRLRDELTRCRSLLESFGRRPEQPICWPRREDKTQMPQPTQQASKQEKLDHICVDRETAGKLYKALGPNGVRWLADDIEETTFINRLTLPPTGEKILLNHTNQVNYVTKNVLFADKKRMSPDDWNLIMRIFDAKKGNIMDVNRRDKTPQNYEKFRELMGILKGE